MVNTLPYLNWDNSHHYNILFFYTAIQTPKTNFSNNYPLKGDLFSSLISKLTIIQKTPSHKTFNPKSCDEVTFVWSLFSDLTLTTYRNVPYSGYQETH